MQWYRYLNDLSYVTPKDTWLTDAQRHVTPQRTQRPRTRSRTQASRRSPSRGPPRAHVDVAAWLDALAKEHGLADAYFTNSTKAAVQDATDVKFSSSATVTADALSHRFDRKAG